MPQYLRQILLEKWTRRPWRNMRGVCTISIDCPVAARWPLARATRISLEAILHPGGPTVEDPVNRREFIARSSLLPDRRTLPTFRDLCN
jgi:hypothetical protein